MKAVPPAYKSNNGPRLCATSCLHNCHRTNAIRDITDLFMVFGWDYLGVVVYLISEIGCGNDSELVERFFWARKHELSIRAEIANIEEARVGMFQCIAVFLNADRLQQTVVHQALSLFVASQQASQVG